MNQKEEQKEHGDEEVNRARGLLAAQDSDGGRKRRRDGGGHGQARPDHQREQNEDHEQIGEPLKHVIRPGFRLTRRPEAQMPGDYGRERPPGEVGAGGKQDSAGNAR